MRHPRQIKNLSHLSHFPTSGISLRGAWAVASVFAHGGAKKIERQMKIEDQKKCQDEANVIPPVVVKLVLRDPYDGVAIGSEEDRRLFTAG